MSGCLRCSQKHRSLGGAAGDLQQRPKELRLDVVVGLQLRGCDSGLGACPRRALSTVHQPAAAASVPDLIPVLSQEPPAKTPVLKTHGTIQEFIFSLYRKTPLPGTALTELSQKSEFVHSTKREGSVPQVHCISCVSSST